MSYSPYRTMSGGRVYRRKRSRSPRRRSSTCKYTPPADRKTWSTGPVGTFSTTASRCPKGSVVAGDGENGERWCCALTQSVRRKYADTLVTKGMAPAEAVAAAVGAIPNRQAAAAAADEARQLLERQRRIMKNFFDKAEEAKRRERAAQFSFPAEVGGIGLAEANAEEQAEQRRRVQNSKQAAAARIQALFRGDKARRLTARKRYERNAEELFELSKNEAAARRLAELANPPPNLAEVIGVERLAQAARANARANALEKAAKLRRSARLASESSAQQFARAARRVGRGIFSG